MRKTVGWVALIGAVLALGGSFGESSTVEAQAPGTLVVGLVAEPVNLDPAQVVLKAARASFLAVLTAGAASIVSPTAVRKHGVDYALSPVGTGPFKFVQWDRGQRVVLEKNPVYWHHSVKLDRIVYRPIVEDQARLTELLT